MQSVLAVVGQKIECTALVRVQVLINKNDAGGDNSNLCNSPASL